MTGACPRVLDRPSLGRDAVASEASKRRPHAPSREGVGTGFRDAFPQAPRESAETGEKAEVRMADRDGRDL